MQKFRRTAIARVFSCMLAVAMVITGMVIPETRVLATETADAGAEGTWEKTDYVANGDFEENDITGWTTSAADDEHGKWEVKTDQWASNNTTQIVNYYNGGDDDSDDSLSANSMSIGQTITLQAGKYKLALDYEGKAGSSGMSVSVAGEGVNISKSIPNTTGWDVWQTLETDSFTLEEECQITVEIKGIVPIKYWGDFDNIIIYEWKEAVKEEINKDKLQSLIDSVPENYESMNFTDTTALVAALEQAAACMEDEEATEEEIETAYNALREAISNLVISDADVFVEKIESLSENTIRGMDVSSYLSIMNSFKELNENRAEGDKLGFKDFDGNLLDEQGFFNFLAGQGVNYIRLRVWNDPYDADGNGYGGGNNDLAAAKEMGKYASNAGMSVLIDFHYSDFWADPSKQQAPKAWADLELSEKVEALSEFTEESIAALVDAGVNVTMVQIGNETNGQICGVDDWSEMNQLFDAGCDAVHKVAQEKGKEILAAVHFTNPETEGRQAGYAADLADYDGDDDGTKEGVSYDVFATSYYPYWHGSLDNLNAVLTGIARKYDKYVMVAETSYANTLQDTDGHDNTVRVGKDDKGADCLWPFTNQGQVNEFRDVLQTVTDVDVTLENGDKAGLGVFYWEGAWIALQNVYDEEGNVDDTLLQQNKEMWEKHGSGWAASYSGEYDSEDAGIWYGGSAVDNQAFFGADGKALSSIKVYNPDYLKYGAAATKERDGYTVSDVTMEVGETVNDRLGNVTVIYNNGESESASVVWNADDIARVNAKAKTNNGIGTYTINGVLEEDESFAVQVKVTIVPKNLLEDYSFEEGGDVWEITGNPVWSGDYSDDNQTVQKNTACVTNEDPHSGTKGFHFYCKLSEFTAEAVQNVTVTEPGTYAANAYAQGSGAVVGVSVSVNSVSVSGNAVQSYESETVELDGWQNWKQPTVNNIRVTPEMLENGEVVLSLRLYTEGENGAWGTWDDAYLYLAEGAYRYPTKISVAPAVINLTEGSTARLAVSFEPEDANATECLFTSTNEAVATVSADGTVTGKKEGKATIRVTSAYDPDVYGEAQVTVTKKVDSKPSTPQTPAETPKPVGTTAKTADASYKVTNAASGAAEVQFTAPVSKTAKSITVPDTITIEGVSYKVTSIADNALKGNKKLTTVKLGNNITKIGKNAFSGCVKLKTVKLDAALQTIDNSAFNGCTALKSLTIPKNVTTIGSKAFNGCKSLKKITVKSTVLKKVGSKTFKGINAKAVIKVPKKQLKTYQKLLKGKGQAKTVKIK